MCDGHPTGTATPIVLIENDRTRVTEWRFAERGDNTGWHRHEYDYIVIPMQDGTLEILGSDGTVTRSELMKGVPYFRKAGVEHDVLNGNSYTFSFVEVELLESSKNHTP